MTTTGIPRLQCSILNTGAHLLLFLVMVTVPVQSGPLPDGCLVGETFYSVGETFYNLDVLGQCHRCTCHNLILCEDVQCPETNCEDPVVPSTGECCPVCTEPDISEGSCTYNGLRVENGATFNPPDQGHTNGTITPNSRCIECTCSDGTVSCEDLSRQCPPFLCDKEVAIIPEDGCCPICPKDLGSNDTDEDSQVCRENGRTYANGDSWHPSLPPFGLITCINCTCEDSHVRCIKLPCPEEPLPPCNPEDPVEPVTLCCPKCYIPTGPPPDTATTAPQNAATLIISPDIQPATPHSSSTIPDLQPCDSSYTVKVWRHKWDDALAAENTEGGDQAVKTYRWFTREGSYVRVEEDVSAESFSSGDYNFLGWTLARRVNGLSSRAGKREKIEACTANCANLVVRLLRPTNDVVGCE